MAQNVRYWPYRAGSLVFDRAGREIGKLVAIRPEYLIVATEWRHPAEVHIPTASILSFDDTRIITAFEPKWVASHPDSSATDQSRATQACVGAAQVSHQA